MEAGNPQRSFRKVLCFLLRNPCELKCSVGKFPVCGGDLRVVVRRLETAWRA